jgi:hypothetical protein
MRIFGITLASLLGTLLTVNTLPARQTPVTPGSSSAITSEINGKTLDERSILVPKHGHTVDD